MNQCRWLKLWGLVSLSLLSNSVAGDSTHTLENITVQSTVVPTEAITRSDEVGKIEINAEEILKLPSVGEADIARALKLVPGVSVGNENSAQLVVQGGAPEQNLTLIDGIPIYSVDHFFGFFSPFNGDAIDGVSIYKNYFPGQYGSRISSVQAYNGTVADQDAYTAGVRLGLLSASFNTGIPIGDRVSLFVAGRRSYTDFLQSPLYDQIFTQFDKEEDLEYEFNTGDIDRTPVFNYSDLNAKLRYADNNDTGEVSFYWSKDQLTVDSDVRILREDANVAHPKMAPILIDIYNDRIVSNSADWGNIGSAGRWARRWNDLLTTKMRAGYTSYFLNSKEHQESQSWYDLSGDSLLQVSQKKLDRDNDNRVEELFGELSGEFWISDNNQLELGFQGQLFTTEYVQTEKFHYTTLLNPNKMALIVRPPYVLDDTVKVTNTNITEGAGTAWLQDNITLGDKFFAGVVARLSYYQGTHDLYFSPRVSLTYDPIPLLRLKVGGGRYYQFVSRAEMEDTYLEGERYFWILSRDNSAPVASSDQISAGFSLNHNGFIFDVDAYFKRLNDISNYLRSSSVEISSFVTGRGMSRGIDFMLQKSIGGYSGWAAYTLSQAVVEYGKEINRGDAYYSPYDRTHELKLVNSYEKGGFNASLTWVYATGTPYSKPIGHDSLQVFNRNFFDVKNSIWGAKNSHRLPDYHRMDISLSYTFSPSDRWDLTLGGSVFNLYNHVNIRGYEYKYIIDENGITGYDDQIQRIESKYMGITPSLFLAVDFRQWRN